jgi:estrone sulfotransferase
MTATAPFPWRELLPEERESLLAAYEPGSSLGDLVRYDNGLLMPRDFGPTLERLYNFALRDDDIWIVTFPKSGTTLTQEMVWMLVNDVVEERGQESLVRRSPYLEMGALMGGVPRASLPDDLADAMLDPLSWAEGLVGRRVLKVHLPIEFLPPGVTKRCKVIYVARGPEDTCVSYYHHLQGPGGCNAGFAEWAELFRAGLQIYGDYWQHLLSGWRARDRPNVKFLWFEEMKKDQRGVIEELCTFLEHPLTPSQVDGLVEHVKFDTMKKNPHADPTGGLKPDFMRKGEVK